MRAWVVFNKEGKPLEISKSKSEAMLNATSWTDLTWEELQGLGYTCQLCIIHPIPVEQLEREEKQ